MKDRTSGVWPPFHDDPVIVLILNQYISQYIKNRFVMNNIFYQQGKGDRIL